jgi:hypothetical protein
MRSQKKDRYKGSTGNQVYHTFIRGYEALGDMTPAKACGIVGKGDNKWITLIQKCRQSTGKIENNNNFFYFWNIRPFY